MATVFTSIKFRTSSEPGCSQNGPRRRRRVLSFPVLACSLLLLLAFGLPALRGQVQNGTITGTVTDPKGALVGDADVTVTQTATGLLLHARTNHAGLYSFQQLIPGDYSITVDVQNFKKVTTTITLTVGQVAQVDMQLTLGSESQTVTVEAEGAAQLDTQTSNLDYTVNSRQVDSLPLNGRNPYGLAVLAPGIMPGQNFGVGVAVARGAVVAAATNNFESNGGIGGNNEILLDGVSIIVCCQGQPAVTPSVEVVNQFKVVTSDPPAQYGRTSGAVLNIATKTGTNSLHGDVYDFLRNDKLDAANFFTKHNGVYPYPGHADFRTPHRENQFGAFIGGPIFIPKIYNGKDKTFFTFGYEGIRNLDPTSGTTTVPTALMRQGVFTEGAGLVYVPTSSNSLTTQKTPIPAASCNGVMYAAGYCIPSTTWDTVAQKYLQYMPLPNLAGITSNYQYVENVIDSANQLNFRVDQDFGKQRIFARGTRDVNQHANYGLFNDANGPNGWTQNLTAYLFALGDVVTLTPNTIVQLTYGFARQTNYQPGNNFYNFNAGNYGFSNNLVSEQQVPGLPVVSFSTITQIGYQSGFNHWAHYVHSLNGSVLMTRGKHNVSIGYNGKLILENQFGLGNPNGSLSFGSGFAGGPYPGSSLPSGQAEFDSWASFLLGTPSGGSLTRQVTTAFNQWWNGVYVQDDYRMTQKLTLNLGLRYDIETGFKERHNNWADFSPTVNTPLNLPGGAEFLCANGNPCRTWETSYHEASPRFGLAYAANPTLVVRGGYGLLFLPTSERGYSDPNIGFSQGTNIPTTATGYTPAVTSENPFPNGVLLPVGPSGGAGVEDGTSISGFEYKNPPSYQQQWNFGIEQSFGSMFTLQMNYAGGHGVHLPMNQRPQDLQPQNFGPIGNPTATAANYNPATAAAITALTGQVANPYYGAPGIVAGSVLLNPTVQRVQLLTAFPQYTSGAISGIQNSSVGISYQDAGSTTYNALQTTVLIHNHGGVNGSVSYVWSKLLGNVSDLTNGFLNTTGNPNYQDFYFMKQYEHSNLATDIPQRVVGTATYALPVGRGKRFGAGMPKWADEAIGGWRVTTIIDVYSGFPLNMGVSGAAQFAGTRPVYVPGVKPLTSGSTHTRLGGTGQPQAYLNPAAFAIPLSFQLGNVPRSAAALRGPLSFDDNASLIKNFPIHEQLGVEFRAEAFNIMNKADFGTPAATLGATGFGNITSQYNLPRNLQLALKIHF